MPEVETSNSELATKKCHFTFSLENVVICIGYLQLALSIITCIFGLSKAFQKIMDYTNELNGLYEEIVIMAVVSYYVSFFLHLLLHAVLGVVLLKGVNKKKLSYVRMWLSIEIFLLIMTMVSVAVFTIFLTFGKYFPELGIHITTAALNIIFISTVATYYRRTKESSTNSRIT